MKHLSRPRRQKISAWLFLLMSSSAISVRAGEPIPAYPVIQRAFLREDFELVARLSPAFLAQHSDASQVGRVWLWFALSLDRLQRPVEALNEFDALKRELPREDALWPELLFWEGEVSRRALQMIRAKSAYGQLLERAPNSPWGLQARLGLGLVYLHQQAFQRALTHFHDLAADGSSTSMSSLALNAQLLEGFCQLRLEHFQEAVTCLEPLLQRLQYPQLVAQAAVYLGGSFSALGRLEDAERAYRRAVEQSDTSRWSRLARFGLGWVYAKMNRCEESIAAFEQYLAPTDEESSPAGGPEAGRSEIEASYAEAWLAQGQCLRRLGRDPEALTRFERIVSNSTGDAIALEGGMKAIEIYRRQGRYAQANEVVHALLRRPVTAIVRNQLQMQLGTLALEQGNVAQARTVFQLAARSPQRAIRSSALSGLGDVQRVLGDVGTAQQFYEEAVRIAEDPSVAAAAWFQLGWLQEQRGAFAQAVTVFQHLVADDNLALADEARLALVITYLHQHEEGLARVLLDTMRRMRPAGQVAARAAYYQALLALDEGQEESAKSLCQETMMKAPGTDEAVEAQLLVIDLEARALPMSEVVARLQQGYASASMRPSAQAKFAKRLGDIARDRRAYDEAIRWYEQAAGLSPALQAELMYRMAACYEEAGERGMAIQWYQRIEPAPWHVKGQLAAAKLLEREARWPEARGIYVALAQEEIPEAKVAREHLASRMTEGRKQ